MIKQLEGKCTEFFGINKGVRQGCVLSPLLFNIFLSDILKELDMNDNQMKIDTMKISSLVWADMVLFADTEENLRKLLKTVEISCNEHKLSINTEKTKCMIFNKSGRLMRRDFLSKRNLAQKCKNI